MAPGAPPSPAAPPVDPRTEALLRRLELDVLRRLDGLLHGHYQGLVPGAGSEPGESRIYQLGDDVRRMDWNVTARTGVPHVRTDIADHELDLWLVVDLSASLAFGTARTAKRDLVLAAAAAVGFLTARGGNRVGALIVPGSGPAVRVPARSGRNHLLGALARMAGAPSVDGSGAADLGAALVEVDRFARRRGMVAVVSDFIAPDDTWARPLRVVGHRHDLLAVEVVDPWELELPDVGFLALVDPETGARVEVPTGSRKVRDRYRQAAAAQRAGIAGAFRSASADHLRLRTDRDWLADLVDFVTRRRQWRHAPPRP